MPPASPRHNSRRKHRVSGWDAGRRPRKEPRREPQRGERRGRISGVRKTRAAFRPPVSAGYAASFCSTGFSGAGATGRAPSRRACAPIVRRSTARARRPTGQAGNQSLDSRDHPRHPTDRPRAWRSGARRSPPPAGQARRLRVPGASCRFLLRIVATGAGVPLEQPVRRLARSTRGAEDRPTVLPQNLEP